MSYSIEPSSADCYEGTTCLINKLDIHDEEKLLQMEGGITFATIQAANGVTDFLRQLFRETISDQPFDITMS